MVGQFGDPMELFQFFIHELNEIAHCYLHPFLKCTIGGTTHFQCQECKVTAAKEPYPLPFVTVVPSVENGLSISMLVHRALSNTDIVKHGGAATYCSCCNELLSSPASRTYLNDWGPDCDDDTCTDRVLVVYVQWGLSDQMHSLGLTVDVSFDLTDLMDNCCQETGMNYLAELSGYIVRKDNHFISINKCVSGVDFYKSDDFAIHLQQNIGRHQNKNWDTPTYLFYTVRKLFHLGCKEEHEPQIELRSSDQHPSNDSLNDPTDHNAACLPRSLPNHDSNSILSSDTEDERRGFDWYFTDPIGSRGYKFKKKFHAGWFEGVVLIDHETGECR